MILSLAVTLWVAGFDVIYSLQDEEFDRKRGLHSLPVKFGTKKALTISQYCHLAAVILWAVFGFCLHLGILYAVGWMLAAGFLFFEHRLISDDDLSLLQTAFFTVNGWIGIFLLIFTILEIL